MQNTLLQGNKTAWSPRHPFPPPRERRARQSPCPRCARPKARFWTAGYYTYQGAASRCRFSVAGYYTLSCKYCEEVSRTDGKVTSRHDQGWSAPRSQPPRLRCAALRQYEQTFHVPSRRLRIEGTFHVFANSLAKTFHFCAAVMLACRSHISAQKFHVRSGTAYLRLSLIAVPRRT